MFYKITNVVFKEVNNMETKLNVAEILKDKPKGTKLYDLLININVKLDNISTTDIDTVVWCMDKTDNTTTRLCGYSEVGTVRGCPDGLQILKPSKEMQDWSKFAWKRGDVLVDDDKNVHIIFEGFDDDTYISFKGKHYLWKEGDEEDYSKEEANMATSLFEKANYKSAQAYINAIEEKLGGKLNLETLEIENTQTEFKDGDIVFEEGNRNYCSAIGVLKKDKEGCSMFDTFLTKDKVCYNSDYIFLPIRLATDSEKQQFFSALAKEGKAWDAEKKEIVDLKPKWTPKTFDKVITRDFDDGVWSANIFSHMNSQGKYVSIGCVEGYAYCLPYNEETAKLIGTTNNAK